MPTADDARSLDAVLPRLMPAAAATSRLLHDRRFRQALALARPAVRLMESHAIPAGPLYQLKLVCDAGEVNVTLGVPGTVSLQILADGQLTPPLQQAGLEAALGPALDALQSIGLTGMRAEGIQPAPHGFPGPWLVIRQDDKAVANVSLPALSDPIQQLLKERIKSVTTQEGRGLRRVLALRGAVELAARPVRRVLVPTLAPGDVLLLGSDDEDARAACRVRFGTPGGMRWTANVHVSDDAITLQGEPAMTADVTDAPAADPYGAQSAKLDDIEIPVRFEVETALVPLHELENLLPGAVIPLAAPLNGATLRLVAAGLQIGRAELIVVGDHLGARILSIGRAEGATP
jgi:type III secretion protein Q